MRGLGTTFGAYKLDQVVLTDAVSVTYRATLARELETVYRGVASNLSRPVLLRITDPFTDDGAGERVAAYLRRVEAAAAVRHPAIVNAIDLGQIDGRAFVATRWTGGVTLEEQIRREGRLEPATACALLLPVADALDTLHDAGVVHAAISPRTIWMDESHGRRAARVTAIGLDASLHDPTLTSAVDAAPGDAFYVAPEQIHNAASPPSTDQYAIACMLYHCVAGRPPFQSATAAARFGIDEPPVSDFGPDEVPAPLKEAIAVGMSVHPRERYANCTAVVVAAQGVPRRPAAPTAPPPPVDAAQAPTAADEPTGRVLAFTWPIAVLLLAVGIAIALAAMSLLGDDAGRAAADDHHPPTGDHRAAHGLGETTPVTR